jgi:23S rRNA-/tRNA-specific pseudouridylate synthase
VRVVHACEALAVVSKSPGVHCQDPRSGLLASLPLVAAGLGAPAGSLRPVHRLDTPVGGLVCLARNLAAARLLSAALREGPSPSSSLLRGYVGLLLSPAPLPAREGVLSAPVKKGGALLPAATRFRVAGEGRAAGVGGALLTALLLAPATGRKHQLRQHVAGALCGGRGGLVGDARYGAAGATLGGGIGLHAAALHVAVGGAGVDVVDALPAAWAPLLARHGLAAPALTAQLLAFLKEPA